MAVHYIRVSNAWQRVKTEVIDDGGSPPATPQNLVGTAISTSEISWSWEVAAGAAVDDFLLKIDNGTAIAVTGTTYSQTGLAAESSHTAEVAARNVDGISPYSLPVTCTTSSVTAPAVSTFTESFNTLDAAKWTIFSGASVAAGELVLNASSSYSTIRSVESFSIQGSAVHVQVNQLPNVDNGSTQAWIDFKIDNDNYMSLIWMNGTLSCRLVEATAETETSVEFDMTTMRLWRLRESAGTLYWETAADTLSWKTQRTAEVPAAWAGLVGKVSLVAGNWNAATSPGQAKFDSVNINDFMDTFTAVNATAWNADKWELSPLLGAATTVNNNRGQLSIPDTDGAMVRMVAKAPTSANQSMLMSYTLASTAARTWIQIWLRGDGTWSGNKPGRGYAVEIATDSARVSLIKYNNATQTGLGATDNVNSLTAGKKQWLRYEANGTTLRYKIWADGTAEPTEWTASVVDTEIATAGQFQICAYRSTSNIGSKTLYFDDVVLTDRVAVVATNPDEPVQPEEPVPGTGVVLDEQFNGTYSLTTGNNGSHPTIWIEGSRRTEPVYISGGLIKVTNLNPDNSDNGFHRMFSRQRYGGPGKSIRFRWRGRCTKLWGNQGSVHDGANLGMKFPQPQSITGYPESDPRSVIGGSGEATPGSLIFRAGLSTDGYMEVARRGYGNSTYLEPWAYNKKVGYTAGNWKDIVIQADWLGSDQMRIRYWHNAGATGSPVYDWTGYAPFNEPGFIWFRTDFADFEYDYVIVEEI